MTGIKKAGIVRFLIFTIHGTCTSALNSDQMELLSLITTSYKANLKSIESFEAKYLMERVEPQVPLADPSEINQDNSNRILKAGSIGVEEDKLYNNESINDGKLGKFTRNGVLARMRPADIDNYVAQSGTPGGLKEFTPTPWDVLDGGLTYNMLESETYEVIGVEEVSREGENQVKVVVTKTVEALKVGGKAKLRLEVFYSPHHDYMPVYLESYLLGKPFGRAEVKKYERIEVDGNLIYIPVTVEGIIRNKKGELQAVRKYSVDTNSIRLNEDIPDEKFNILVTNKDTLYDLDLSVTVSAPHGSIDFTDTVVYKSLENADVVGARELEQLSIDLCDGVTISLEYLPPGEFVQGSPDTEIGYGDFARSNFTSLRPKNEGPLHSVIITNGLYIGIYEVTNAQYRCFNSSYHQPRYEGYVMDGDNQPAAVNWFEAKSFCQWLSKKTGDIVRLPTESEWEYACRAGTASRFFWGDEMKMACKYANVFDEAALKVQPESSQMLKGTLFECNDGFFVTAPVGSFVPNGFGLYDMIGNFSEWTEDIFAEYDHKQSHTDTPKPDDKIWRVVRGGGYNSKIDRARSAARAVAKPGMSMAHFGFRIVVQKK